MKPGIWYKETKWRLRRVKAHKEWLGAVLARESRKAGRVDYVFTDNNYIHELNREYLGHDYETDVIAFDYGDEGLVSGEIYISVNNVYQNSVIYETDPETETRRVMVHGLLHLCGYRDEKGEDRNLMTEREELYLGLFEDEFQL